MLRTIELTLPETADISDFELKMIIDSKLYELGKLSSGQGAEAAGLSKRTFLELLGKYGVSIFGYNSEEMKDELSKL